MAALFISLTASVVHGQTENAGQQKLRSAGVAGSFYLPIRLRWRPRWIACWPRCRPSRSMDRFCGGRTACGLPLFRTVAAYTYASLKGLRFSRIVVIAPSHFESFDFTSVYDGDGYVPRLGRCQATRYLSSSCRR